MIYIAEYSSVSIPLANFPTRIMDNVNLELDEEKNRMGFFSVKPQRVFFNSLAKWNNCNTVRNKFFFLYTTYVP